MFFMEILMDYLTNLLPKDAPEYKAITDLEHSLLERLQAAAGQDLVEKLTDAQEERLQREYQHFFLCGLRLGVELLRLQGG